MPVATGYSRLSDHQILQVQQVQRQHHCEMMWLRSLGVGDIGIEGGRSLQGARGPVWDSRDVSFGWATALKD
eukprot:3940882-Rhodomonas_salina.1